MLSMLLRIAWRLPLGELALNDLDVVLELGHAIVSAFGGRELEENLLVSLDDDDEARVADAVGAVLGEADDVGEGEDHLRREERLANEREQEGSEEEASLSLGEDSSGLEAKEGGRDNNLAVHGEPAEEVRWELCSAWTEGREG